MLVLHILSARLPMTWIDNVDIKQISGALLICLLSPPAIPRGSDSLVRSEEEREQVPSHRAQTRIDPCHQGTISVSTADGS